MPKSSLLTMRLEPELETRLERIAKREDRTFSYLAHKALEQFVERWETKEAHIKQKG